MKTLIRILLFFFTLSVLAGGVVLGILVVYGNDLPDHRVLRSYEPDVVTRIHAFDGQLFDEVASENRVFAPIAIIPQKLINGFIAVEDERFYDHFGINPLSITRAFFQNITRYQDGKRPVGASTITQQVAKNFLLDNSVSYERKIREAIISIRLEQALDKDQIMELYLNDIYLGRGNYGVAAAALNYFDKSMDELSVSEIAFLASLPKAPNRYSQPKNKDLAITRRNWVIRRMEELGFISFEQAQKAITKPLGIKRTHKSYRASYFLAETKRRIKNRFPQIELSKDGLYIKTTLSPAIQEITTKSFRRGLMAYDSTRGYRGALQNIKAEHSDSLWLEKLQSVPSPVGILDDWHMAVVTKILQNGALILLQNGNTGMVHQDSIGFTHLHLTYQKKGSRIKSIQDVLAVGDVVLVSSLSSATDDDLPKESSANAESLNLYRLQQIPEINGGVVVMNVHTGRVLALQGGWSFQASEFNRATQARRQIGSAIKPFVYTVALENGMTPSSLILDAPFVAGSIDDSWKPQNFSKKFLGPQPMRVGLEKSLNTMTVRLAHQLGIGRIIRGLQRFNIAEKIPPELSVVLGAKESTVIRMAAAYASLVNNGYKVQPSLIDKIQDRYGKVIYKLDNRICKKCQHQSWQNQFPPYLASARKLIVDPATAYQVVHMLEGVVERGTAVRLKNLNLPIAGKTGTTNDNRDAWFFGLTSDLVIGIYAGFDLPQDLGVPSTTIAVPMFKDIVTNLKNETEFSPFHVPSGIRLVRIDRKSGDLPNEFTTETILEAYKTNEEPGEGLASLNEGNLVEALQEATSANQQDDKAPALETEADFLPQAQHEDFIGPIYQPFYDMVEEKNKSENFSSIIY